MPEPEEFFDPFEEEQEEENEQEEEQEEQEEEQIVRGVRWDVANVGTDLPNRFWADVEVQEAPRRIRNNNPGIGIDNLMARQRDRLRLVLDNSNNPYRSSLDELDNYSTTLLRKQMEQMSSPKRRSKATAVPVASSAIKKVGLAYPAFTEYIKNAFSDFRILRTPEDVKEVDLVVFSGGCDIDPALYRQKDEHCFGKDKRRDTVEIEMFKAALYNNKKMLGICRGHQLINALLGGSLVQDIGIQLSEHHPGDHELQIVDKGVVYKFYSNTHVNSMHHQGVVNTGRGLLTTSYYNSVVESTENDNIVTVQFHPEFMMDSASRAFFSYLETTW